MGNLISTTFAYKNINNDVLMKTFHDMDRRMKCTGDFLKDSYSERNMRFGIREFGMGAVSNALSLDKTGGAWQSLDEL